jgi:3-deoxy-manno-octulosonate cytidylyltransferase (CMP-KDO synthetase)
METIGIIPARYSSTRFPGKPLAIIAGKTMIQRVYEQAKKTIECVIVATDDKKILDNVISFGGQAIMTSEKHKSGTDRCLEALEKYEQISNKKFDIIVNIQGDEPLISPIAIKKLIDVFDNRKVQIATLVNKKKFSEELNNPNKVKVTRKLDGFASYFSRSLIPYVRDKKILSQIDFYTHIGIYAYKNSILKTIAKQSQTMNEIAESLEQNRWLDNGLEIMTVITDYESIGVDTKEDIDKIIKQIEKK